MGGGGGGENTPSTFRVKPIRFQGEISPRFGGDLYFTEI